MTAKTLVASSLAETFAFSLKARLFSWNVRGPLFVPLRVLFAEIHDEVDDAVDGLAERLRALGVLAPGSLHEIEAGASIRFGEIPDAAAMVAELLAGNEAVAAALTAANDAALQASDCGLSNYLQGRLDAHARWDWQLRATLDAG
jgi:starvation-inducible DNA-binding protein